MTIERRAVLVSRRSDDLAGYSNPDDVSDVLASTARMRQRRAQASMQRCLAIDSARGSCPGPPFGPSLPTQPVLVRAALDATYFKETD